VLLICEFIAAKKSYEVTDEKKQWQRRIYFSGKQTDVILVVADNIKWLKDVEEDDLLLQCCICDVDSRISRRILNAFIFGIVGEKLYAGQL
jgi:hypothetical protein